MAVTETVMAVIVGAITLVIGILVVATVYGSMSLPTYAAVNENFTGFTNNTATSFANSPVVSLTAVDNNTVGGSGVTCVYGTDRYSFASTTLTLFYNNTTAVQICPTLTPAGNSTQHVYVDYSYQSSIANTTAGGINTTVFNAFALMAVVLIIMAAVAILAYFGFGVGKA